MEREPEYLGSGEMMALQSYGNLIIGDHVWDIDYAWLCWNGTEWVQIEDWHNLNQIIKSL